MSAHRGRAAGRPDGAGRVRDGRRRGLCGRSTPERQAARPPLRARGGLTQLASSKTRSRKFDSSGSAASARAVMRACRRHSAAKPGRRVCGTRLSSARKPAARQATRRWRGRRRLRFGISATRRRLKLRRTLGPACSATPGRLATWDKDGPVEARSSAPPSRTSGSWRSTSTTSPGTTISSLGSRPTRTASSPYPPAPAGVRS